MVGDLEPAVHGHFALARESGPWTGMRMETLESGVCLKAGVGEEHRKMLTRDWEAV